MINILQTTTSIMLLLCTVVLMVYITTQSKQTKNTYSTKDSKPISAKDAYNQSIKPQLIEIFRHIDDAKNQGKTKTTIDCMPTIASENIDILLALGYDIHLCYYQFTENLYIEIYFSQTASGVLTYGDTETKTQVNYHNSKPGTHDICEKHKI